MITVIAEKPSVARDIANILGATTKGDGHFIGNNYAVTWAFGHLIGLAMPEHYGHAGFKRENLPIIPLEFLLTIRQIRDGKTLKPDPGASKQLRIIKELFKNSEKIIVATDAGREGELIFRYIYQYVGSQKPFERLWISSLTDKAIKDGFQNLKPGKNYDNLYLSAKCRSEADWLVGINSSQALSIAAEHGTFSLGRVQTPTLSMICSRFLENKKFISQKYWEINVQTEKNNIQFKAICPDHIQTIERAEEILNKVKNCDKFIVVHAECKEISQQPPLLYDLTSLQKDVNVRLNFSAEQTLSIAQSLYEAKFISYPRTGSRYISQDVFEEIPKRISLLQEYEYFSSHATRLQNIKLNENSVNDSKVTDHHALIITDNLPNKIEGEKKAIYDLIAGRMLEAFSSKCIKDVTTILMDAFLFSFIAKGSVIKQLGWKSVFNINETNDDEKLLPSLSIGDILPIKEVLCLEKQTKPQPLHTEASLLTKMESAGRELENNEFKEIMKDTGIGTPATRASIIETLLKREYIQREKKNLIPTEKGLYVYNAVKDKKIANAEMTGQWENSLAKIERGEIQTNVFQKNIESYVKQVTEELLNIQISSPQIEQPSCKCPKCKGTIRFFNKVAKCNNETCELTIFREICKKTLTDKEMEQLLSTGKTSIIKGFKSTKTGKKFDAAIKLSAEFKTEFHFCNKD